MAKTYEAMKRVDSPSSNNWHFLDLKNRKQVGDLEKRILKYKQNKNFKVFNFSSSREKEGVSTILINLISYIKNQDSVTKILVIDANFASPSLDRFFNIHDAKGLSDVITGNQTLEDSLISLESMNITLLPSGQSTKSISDSLSYEKLITVIDSCKKKYDTILIDSAPLLTAPDALSTALSSDVTFLVVQSLSVQKEVALKTKQLLKDNECTIGGVILNRVSQSIPGWIYKFI